MAQTLPDVALTKQTWINLYSTSGITSGSQVVVFNKGSTPVLLVSSSTQPTNTQSGVNLLVDSNMIISSSTMGLWAYALNSEGSVSIQTSTVEKYRQGNLQTTVAHSLGMNFETAVMLNLVPGARRVVALGNNPDIDTGTYPEDIYPAGGIYPWPTAATTLQVVSTDVNDTSAGTGARTVLVSGLNSSFAEISELVTLNGTTVVTTTQQFYRVNSCLIMSAGTNGTNIGDIDVKNSSNPTNILARIQSGKGISRSSNYTVPLGWTLAINSLFFGINRPTSTTDASFATYFGNPNGFYRLPLELSVSGSPYRHDVKTEIPVLEKNDFILRGTYVSQTNADVTAAWSGILYQTSIITAL